MVTGEQILISKSKGVSNQNKKLKVQNSAHGGHAKNITCCLIATLK